MGRWVNLASVYLTYLSTRLSTYMSVYLPVCLSTRLPIYLSVSQPVSYLLLQFLFHIDVVVYQCEAGLQSCLTAQNSK